MNAAALTLPDQLVPLPPEDADVYLVAMLTSSRAVDLFLGDFSRRSRSKNGKSTEDYRRLLYLFVDGLRPDEDVTKITPDDCRRYMDRFRRCSAGTQATNWSVLNSFTKWLYRQERIRRNPMDFVPRPRRIASEDLDVVAVSTADVPKLLDACRTDSERIALAILAYLGPRRNAVATLRLSDYDREAGMLRFREKGSKTIWKPVPRELAAILDAAVDRGSLVNAWQPADPYLVPPEGPLVRSERDDRVIWRLVKTVAAEAGVEAHVHALRAAFATFYLEQPNNRNDLVGLQELMGHRSIDTTRIYLRKLDKRDKMEPVRDLSWGAAGQRLSQPTVVTSGSPYEETFEAVERVAKRRPQTAGKRFAEPSPVGAGGFEPPQETPADEYRAGSEHGGGA